MLVKGIDMPVGPHRRQSIEELELPSANRLDPAATASEELDDAVRVHVVGEQRNTPGRQPWNRKLRVTWRGKQVLPRLQKDGRVLFQSPDPDLATIGIPLID